MFLIVWSIWKALDACLLILTIHIMIYGYVRSRVQEYGMHLGNKKRASFSGKPPLKIITLRKTRSSEGGNVTVKLGEKGF